MSSQLHQLASGGPLKEPPPDVGSHGPSQTTESDDFDGGGRGGPPLLPMLEGPEDLGSPFSPTMQGQPPRVHPTAQERACELDGDGQCLKRLSKEGPSLFSDDEGSALDEASRHDETLFCGPEDAKSASLSGQIGLGEGPPLSFISTRPEPALHANWGPFGAPLGSPVENPRKSPLVACLEGPLEAPLEAPLEVPLGTSPKDPSDAPLEAPLDASLEAQLEAPLGALTGGPVGASLSASLLSPQEVSWHGVPQRPLEDSSASSLNFMDALCSLALVDRSPPPSQLQPQQRQRTSAAYRATRHDSLLSAASTASSVARGPLNASEGSKGYRGAPQLPSLRSSGDPWTFAMQGVLPAQQQQKQQRRQQQRPVQQQSMQLQMLQHQAGQQKQHLPVQQEQQRRPQLQQHFARQQQRTLQHEHQALQQLQRPHQQGWQQHGAPVSAQLSLNHIEAPAASISFQEMKDPLWSLTTHPETEAAFESASIIRVQHQAICPGIQRLPQRAPLAQFYSVCGAESLDPSSSGSSGVHEQQLLQQLPLQGAAQGASLAPTAATEACSHLQFANSDLEGAAMRAFSGAPEGHRGSPGEFNVILKCYLELLLRKQQEQQRQRQQQQRQRQPQRQHQQQQQQRQQLQQQRLFQRGLRRQRGQRGAPAAPLGVFGAAQLREDPPGWVAAAGYLQQQQQQLLIRAEAAAEERSPATNAVINALPATSRSEGGTQGPPQGAHFGGISPSWPPCHDPVRARLMQFVTSPGVESFPAAADGAAAYMVPDLLQGGPPCMS